MKLAHPFAVLMLFFTGLHAEPLVSINAEQLQTLQQQQALIIDIRTDAEWQATGVIAGSQKLQAFDSDGKFDQEGWLNKVQKLRSSDNQPIILVCRSGKRSEKLGDILTKQLGMNQVYHLSSGIQGWTQSGKSLTANCSASNC